MPTIDHPLLEAQRAIQSGMLSGAFADRVRDEFRSGTPTAARLRASVFELMGPDWQGRVPVLVEESVELGPDDWMVVGTIDDTTVLTFADGSSFLDVTFPETREMVAFSIDPAEGAKLLHHLANGGKPVYAIDPLGLLDLGDEVTARAEVAKYGENGESAA